MEDEEDLDELKVPYRLEPTAHKFHASDVLYRGVKGPVRSGKSTMCSQELIRRGQEQKPGPDGIRHSRFLACRNTYRELEDTTLKTWLMWFPERDFGRFSWRNMSHVIRMGDMEMEVLFRALDSVDDVQKVLSLELTGAWVNEAREIPKGIIDALGDRVGQYPPLKDGGCTWSGVIMDTNPPDSDHWWYRLCEKDRPDPHVWQFFNQPGALIEQDAKFVLNPAAENIRNLQEGVNYYLKRCEGKDPDYIRVYYCGQYGFVKDGKAVFPEYVDAVHCAPEDLPPMKNLLIYLGIDFGLTPAAVFAQQLPNGRWVVIDELVTEEMGTAKFAENLKRIIRRDYQGFRFLAYGDPTGDNRSPTDEVTPYNILRAAAIDGLRAIDIKKAPTNDRTLREDAVRVCLSRMIDGKPGLMLSPKASITRKGMAGGYCYRRLKIAGDDRYEDYPSKNKYSHPCEGLEYLLLGAGEGRKLITPHEPEQSVGAHIYIPTGSGAWMAA